MLSLSPAPAAAAGQLPIFAWGFGAMFEPIVAITRIVAAAKSTFHPASLRTALADRIEAASVEGGKPGGAAGNVPASTGSIAPPSPAKQQADLLASVAIPFGRLPAQARMQPIYSEIESGLYRNCLTAICENARDTLELVVERGRERGFLNLIRAVNRSVNTLIAYRRDSDVHGVLDLWAKPSSTLNSGVGDCEDYAILKMAVLKKAGIPAKSMSLVVLRDERRGVYHAVLAIRTSQGSFILDNLDSAVRRDVELPDYMPLYSVSAGRGYIYGRRNGEGMLSASTGKFEAIAPGEGLDEIPALDPRSHRPQTTLGGLL
jgi:predicted transglutaminase-like cysteine proteinase